MAQDVDAETLWQCHKMLESLYINQPQNAFIVLETDRITTHAKNRAVETGANLVEFDVHIVETCPKRDVEYCQVPFSSKMGFVHGHPPSFSEQRARHGAGRTARCLVTAPR